MTTLYDLSLIISSQQDSNDVINNMISQLITSYCIDEQTLKYALNLMNLSDYELLLKKRYQYNRCGYPLCPVIIPASSVTDPLLYCDSLHFDCSQFVKTQLGPSPKWDLESLLADYRNVMNNPSNIILFEELLRDKLVENELLSLSTDIKMFRFR